MLRATYRMVRQSDGAGSLSQSKLNQTMTSVDRLMAVKVILLVTAGVAFAWWQLHDQVQKQLLAHEVCKLKAVYLTAVLLVSNHCRRKQRQPSNDAASSELGNLFRATAKSGKNRIGMFAQRGNRSHAWCAVLP